MAGVSLTLIWLQEDFEALVEEEVEKAQDLRFGEFQDEVSR